MISKVIKLGNSLSVRLPSVFTKELKLSENSPVEIKSDKEKIIIIPMELKQYDSKELFSRISEENIHRETETGNPQGGEIW
jgi:antitoxin component of MazEF toxin-antitoxin module